MIKAFRLSICIYLALLASFTLPTNIQTKPKFHPSSTPDKISAIQPIQQKDLQSFEEIPTCASELKKYSWNQSVAYNVMLQESGGDTNILVNDSDDLSIGCFQVNVLGDSNLSEKYGLAVSLGYVGSYSREELIPWLQNAENNVAVAHLMWSRSGWQPWSFQTCKIVECY
ncbi:hypothetical protein UFOVP585_19 [uncultured Caudovirales phage]|uniref:Transglycosylase SLT domain-containing protein n=1 Tax=uncultured Caudovirales phage TaxID=2100421 RepID=A0A6J5N6X2_9CAUD|nr:hypothetical protein UFOVP585_19 [uncultured Caudovirales phage]